MNALPVMLCYAFANTVFCYLCESCVHFVDDALRRTETVDEEVPLPRRARE